jgi:hypothetical protein
LTLGKILRYTCEHTAGTETHLKEYEIATEVLRRPHSFDPKLDPVVRVSMKGIRDRLQEYFDDEGKHEPLGLTIPKGEYRVEFAERLSPPRAVFPESTHFLRYFWTPHLAKGQANIVMYTEPLFFREGWETYVRNLYINNPETGTCQIKDRLPELKARELKPSFHYLDAGEVHSVFSLTQFFSGLGAPAEVRNARVASWRELRHSNLVLLGCTRTNPFMDVLQEEANFIVGEDEIRNDSPREGELRSYRGERYSDSKLPRYREYVLITRRPGASQDSTITMIAANHGRAIEGGTNYLTSSREMTGLLSTMNVDQRTPMPNRFQILLRAEMIDLDDEIVNVEYVSHRVAAQ